MVDRELGDRLNRGAMRREWRPRSTEALRAVSVTPEAFEDGEGSGPRPRLGVPRGGAGGDLEGALRALVREAACLGAVRRE